MLAKNILIGSRLGRPANCTAGAMLVVLCLAGSAADAGVILPWVQPNETSPELLIEVANIGSSGCGSSSLPDVPPSNPIEQPAERPADRTLMGVLADCGGGASAPGGNSSGQASAVPAAIFSTADAKPIVGCSQRKLRECAPKLPQPPLGELLDPPKSCD